MFLVLAYPGCPAKRPLNGCSSSSSSSNSTLVIAENATMPTTHLMAFIPGELVPQKHSLPVFVGIIQYL